MLFTETVNDSTLGLLSKLQSKTYLKGFYLVGGTALALRIGHRKSIDLDLFSNESFDVTQMLENLSADFDFQLFYSANNTIKGSIDNIRTDILSHRYPLLNEPFIEEGFEMLSLQDIIAMKLNAISGSGQRVKDFIDVFFLLRQFSLAQMLGFYKDKYKQFNEMTVLKSLIYFGDIDFTDWPEMIGGDTLEWQSIADTLEKAVKDYLQK